MTQGQSRRSAHVRAVPELDPCDTCSYESSQRSDKPIEEVVRLRAGLRVA
jgi:hypothetical protein